MIIIVLGIFTAVAALHVPGLIRKQYWRELAVFGSLWSIGFLVGLLLALGVELPYVSTMIGQVIEQIFNLK